MRIAIFGGSYNPIHIGHIQLAKALCQQGVCDKLWLLVSPQNPFKQASTDLLDENIRLKLTRLAVANEPNIEVSDFEFQLPRPSYMVNTLAKMREAYPEHTFVLVIGADNWVKFSKWYKSDEIMQHHELAVYPRPEYDIEFADEKNSLILPPSNTIKGVRFVNTPLYPISSSMIRQAISNGTDYSQWVTPEVFQYIETNKLYR